MSATATLDAAVCERLAHAALYGLPEGTIFNSGWSRNLAAYRIMLTSPAHSRVSVTTIDARDFECVAMSDRAICDLLCERIDYLRLRHYFACVYERGGYC